MEELQITKVFQVQDPRVAAALTTYTIAHGLPAGYPVKDRSGNLSFVFEGTAEIDEVINLLEGEELRINAAHYLETLMEIEGFAPYPFGNDVRNQTE